MGPMQENLHNSSIVILQTNAQRRLTICAIVHPIGILQKSQLQVKSISIIPYHKWGKSLGLGPFAFLRNQRLKGKRNDVRR